MKKAWELRQIHENEVEQILRDNECFAKGTKKITRFNGKVIWPIMEERGHTSLDFDKCKCRLKYE